MKTLAGIAHGYAANLIMRAADVTIKEGRKLILVPRETPLSPIHLENMLTLARLGVVIMPPMPAFYYRPRTVDDVVNHLVARILDHLGLEQDLVPRWGSPGRIRPGGNTRPAANLFPGKEKEFGSPGFAGLPGLSRSPQTVTSR